MAVDVSRKTAGLVELPTEISSQIWADTIENSIVQTLCPKISMPAGGITIPMITGDPEAGWVNETDEKPVGDSTFGSKVITPYKMAVIELFSDEFRRDYGALYAALAERLPKALGRLFDETTLGQKAAPGSGFDTLADAPAVELNGYDGYLAALSSVSAGGGDVTSWALSPSAEIATLGFKDANERPMFIPEVTTAGSVGSVLARPVYRAKNAKFTLTDLDGSGSGTDGGTVVGIAGDWSSATWGSVEGIKVAMTDQGTINKGGTQYNLWQRNMFAIRAEVEVGFAVRDPKRFAKLVEPAATPPAGGGGEG